MVRPERQTLRLGRLRLTVIGPFQRDLEQLRKEWNEWLQTQDEALDRLRSRMRADAERLGASRALSQRHEQRAAELGSATGPPQPGFTDAAGRGGRPDAAAHRRRAFGGHPWGPEAAGASRTEPGTSMS